MLSFRTSNEEESHYGWDVSSLILRAVDMTNHFISKMHYNLIL